MRKCSRGHIGLIGWLSVALFAGIAHAGADEHQRWFNEPLDIGPDFADFRNETFVADRVTSFSPQTGQGVIQWKRHIYRRANAFNNERAGRYVQEPDIFPSDVYPTHPELAFAIQFVSGDTVRLRMVSAQNPPAAAQWLDDSQSLMLDGPVDQLDSAWQHTEIRGLHEFKSRTGSVTIRTAPFAIVFRDAAGRILTRTRHPSQNIAYSVPADFSFIKRASDYSRSFNAAFQLSPGEMIFGCGENFQNFNKVGQKVVLSVTDAMGVDTPMMYKPIPFFMSSRGYGMFMHTSTPVTADFGAAHDDTISLMIGDDTLDLFVFFGEPKAILNAYTEVTGKSPMPPLWSFGFWMSRITYESEQQVRDVAAKLREHRIPSDVIHLDTGWFETDWQCDYQFSKSRFDDPKKMLADLRKQGFRASLWQLPYFVPQNRLFPAILEKELYVRGENGGLATEDAILDFSNPDAVKWYQDNLGGLLKMGVGAIKVDFGEAAPMNGFYHSGRTGFYEHNLYPLRYNKAAADITEEINGEHVIWARSAWAGSQRYPLHWGGDAASNDAGMAATLRGGLSFGLSGFAFWSHDIGGFTRRPSIELYRRWAAFGFLTSHTRAHGQPPREPWEYGEELLADFRKAAEMRYRLMPYIYAQAKDSSERGLPMLRALFVEYPGDPGAWRVDDQFLLGSDLLVAPLMLEDQTAREVYLPGGTIGDFRRLPQRWVDYQSGKVYEPGWQTIEAGEVAAVILAREGAAIPHIALAQSTDEMDWSKLELKVAGEATRARGLVYRPGDEATQPVELIRGNRLYTIVGDPFGGDVEFDIGGF